MKFVSTPRELAYTSARWFVIFIVGLIVATIVEFLWFMSTAGEEFEKADVGVEGIILASPIAFVFFLPLSQILPALSTSFVGWVFAFVGTFFAKGGQRIALVFFGFATFTAARGLGSEYWYAAIPSILALGYLTIGAWRLRNVVEVATVNPGYSQDLMESQHALHQKEMMQQDIISRS